MSVFNSVDKIRQKSYLNEMLRTILCMNEKFVKSNKFLGQSLNGDRLELTLHPLSNWRQCFALAGSLQPLAKSTFQ